MTADEAIELVIDATEDLAMDIVQGPALSHAHARDKLRKALKQLVKVALDLAKRGITS